MTRQKENIVAPESVLAIKRDGFLTAIVYNDITRRAQIIYSVKEMGADEIQDLLTNRGIIKQ